MRMQQRGTHSSGVEVSEDGENAAVPQAERVVAGS